MIKALNQIIDAISAGCFKTLDNGQRTYFPNGAFGAGFALPDDAAAERVRQALRRMWYVILTLCAVSGPLTTGLFKTLDTSIALGLVVLLLAAIAMGTRTVMQRAANGLEKVSASLTIREAVQAQIKAMPRWYSILQVAFCALMVLAGTFTVSNATTNFDWAWGIAATASFAALLVYFLYTLAAKSKPVPNGA